MIQSNLCLKKITLITVEARGAAGGHLGSHWNPTMQYGGLDQGDNDGGSEKGSDSGYILKLEQWNLLIDLL